jgi:hypothetical protein
VLAAIPALGMAADEPAPKPEAAKQQGDAPGKPMMKQNIKAREPMAGEMKKPGMKQGDVKKAAAEKDKVMKEPMREEERAMK